MKYLKIVCLLFVIVFISACSIPVTRVDVQNFAIKTNGVTTEKAMNTLTLVFIDKGFDVKMTNKDAGVITTEYKKFASLSQNPPFDFYMQIKGKLRTTNQGTLVELSPIVKEQNRANAAAYTEHELGYYVGSAHDISLIRSMRTGTGWRAVAQTLFADVVSETAKAFNIRFEDVIQNVTKTEANAFLAN